MVAFELVVKTKETLFHRLDELNVLLGEVEIS